MPCSRFCSVAWGFEVDTAPVIDVHGLCTRFGAKRVHEDISLSIRRGEAFAIVGGSGSGKTTLLRELLLLQRPTAGSISVLGERSDGLDRASLRRLRRRTGVLFQDGALFGGMTVGENVALPLREHTGLRPPLLDEIVALKIALTGLDPETAVLYPSQLSGGMRKRAALARALALDPELLFLDEPTAGLDPVSAAGLDELIGRLKGALGLTIVMVTHDLDSLREVADRIVLLGEGRILGEGTMGELMGNEHPLVRAFFAGPRGRAVQ